MATTEEVHIADIGTRIIITVKEGTTIVNLATASTKKIRIKRKDGTVIDVDADLYTDGVDGKLTYLTKSGDLAGKGEYKIQVYLVFPSGTWHSSIETFTVSENIKD